MGALAPSKASFIEPETTSLKCDGQGPAHPAGTIGAQGWKAVFGGMSCSGRCGRNRGPSQLLGPLSCHRTASWSCPGALWGPPPKGGSGCVVGPVLCLLPVELGEARHSIHSWGAGTATSRNRQLVHQCGKWFGRIYQSWRSASGHEIPCHPEGRWLFTRTRARAPSGSLMGWELPRCPVWSGRLRVEEAQTQLGCCFPTVQMGASAACVFVRCVLYL